MPTLKEKITSLVLSLVFGGTGLLILTSAVFKWSLEDSTKAALLFVVLVFALATLAELRHIAGGTGAFIGHLFASAIAGAVTSWENVRGPGKAARTQMRDKLVEATLLAVDKVPVVEPRVSLMKLNITLDAIIMAAHEGKPWSRDFLVKGDITTQGYWNLANHILKLLGMRQERSTKLDTRGSAVEDLRFIKAAVRVIDDVVLVKERGVLGWKRVDLHEAHFDVD